MNAHLSAFILTRCHGKLPFASSFSPAQALESGMRLKDPRNTFKDAAELCVVFVEYHDSSLAIAPSQIPKKLVDGL